jgi:hypothetical protein
MGKHDGLDAVADLELGKDPPHVPLRRRSDLATDARRRGPALYLGVLFALEIVGNFTVFDVLSDLRHQGSWSDFANGVG